MTGRKKRCSVLAVMLLLLLLSVQCSRRKQTEQKEEAVTITWYVAKEGYSKEWDPKDNLADAKILKNTGINLEITSGDLTQLDALMATDSLPDLITVEVDAPERTVLENTGMV